MSPTYSPSIIINSDNQILFALNPANGVKNWQFSIPNAVSSPTVTVQPSPLLYNEMIYIPGAQGIIGNDTIYKINSQTGALVTKFHFLQTGVSPCQIQATPIAVKNLIFIAALNDTLYAIDTGTGKTQWKYSPGPTGLATSGMISSPVIYNDTVYGATTDGVVFAVPVTETPVTVGAAVTAAWTYQSSSPSSGSLPYFVSSPAVSAPFLYIGCVTDSNMYCLPLDAPSGLATNVPNWTFKTHGSIYSSPAALDGVCIFGCNDFYVYCLDTFLQRSPLGPITTVPGERWKYATTSSVYSSPVLVGNVVYACSYDYNVYAINVANGSYIWSFKTNALIKSSPVVYGGLVYVGSYDKYLYALDTSLGTLQWKYPVNGQIECSPVIDDLSGADQINSQISGYTN